MNRADRKVRDPRPCCLSRFAPLLGAGTWLALAESHRANDYRHRENLERWRPLWQAWKQKGVVWDASALSTRHVTLLQSQFPEEFGPVAPTAPSRRRRSP